MNMGYSEWIRKKSKMAEDDDDRVLHENEEENCVRHPDFHDCKHTSSGTKGIGISILLDDTLDCLTEMYGLNQTKEADNYRDQIETNVRELRNILEYTRIAYMNIKEQNVTLINQMYVQMEEHENYKQQVIKLNKKRLSIFKRLTSGSNSIKDSFCIECFTNLEKECEELKI
jgi:hypothetical protein